MSPFNYGPKGPDCIFICSAHLQVRFSFRDDPIFAEMTNLFKEVYF